MSNEADPEIQGVLIKNQTIILEPNRQQELEQKGYGEMEKDKLFLKPFESLYLLYTGKLALFKGKKNIDFDSFLQICKKQHGDILTKFLVYRDLRNKGYTVKDGFGLVQTLEFMPKEILEKREPSFWSLVSMRVNRKRWENYKKKLKK